MTATSPTWIPDVDFGDIDEAIASAEKWLAHQPGGSVDVVQVRRSTGRAVLSVSADGVEKLAPVHRRRTADDMKLLRQAKRHSVTIKADTVTIRRRWRSTRFVTAGSEARLAESIDEAFGPSLEWHRSDPAGAPRRFRYGRGEIERVQSFDVWVGSNAFGRIGSTDGGSHLVLRFRPTAGSAAWMIFGLLFLSPAVFATALWIDGSDDFGWWMPLGIAMGAGMIGGFGWPVLKYRREIDIEFIDALAGISRSKEVQRQRHRTRRTTWRSL